MTTLEIIDNKIKAAFLSLATYIIFAALQAAAPLGQYVQHMSIGDILNAIAGIFCLAGLWFAWYIGALEAVLYSCLWSMAIIMLTLLMIGG